MKTEKRIFSREDLEQYKKRDGAVIELPEFDEQTPFIAQVKRPSLFDLCKNGDIPNPLLSTAQELFEGKLEKGNIVKYKEVLEVVAKASLVEPTYEQVKDVITDEQLISIFDYALKGVVALVPFLQNKSFYQSIKSISLQQDNSIKALKNKK